MAADDCVDDEMAVTKATCSGNGSERVDGNGVATATASLLVPVLEPILEEYAGEARFNTALSVALPFGSSVPLRFSKTLPVDQAH